MSGRRQRLWAVLWMVSTPILARGQERPVGPAAREAFFTTLDSVRIRYVTLGDTGSWVVLIHGYMDSAERTWFRSGIAAALAAYHRVVAFDHRNHGRSDAPRPGEPGRADDVIELMDHLNISRAHIHGYSMGGVAVAYLLATHPDRFRTAVFGGSGIFETDESLRARADSSDKPLTTPPGVSAELAARLRAIGEGKMQEISMRIDLTTLTIPVLAINGEFDRPTFKTQRMVRELREFQSVVLPGRNHMTTLGFLSAAPPEYVGALLTFIAGHDK